MGPNKSNDVTIQSPNDRHIACTESGNLLMIRYENTLDEQLVTEAADLFREALELCPQGHPDRPSSCVNLASCLWLHHMYIGDDDLLSQAIALNREAFSLCPVGHVDRGLCCAKLALTLKTRWKADRIEDMHLLEEIIILEREALALRPVGHPDHAASCRSLSRSLQNYYQWHTRDDSLIVEAIDLQREVHTLLSQGHADYASSCMSLASLLSTHYKRTGDIGLLSEAIVLGREALNRCPEGHPDYVPACVNLAGSLTLHYKRTGDSQVLGEVIDLERQANALRPLGHPEHEVTCSNLASSLSMAYERTGDRELLVESIRLQREALSLRPEGHPTRAAACVNLAVSLWTCSELFGDGDLLAESTLLSREALSLRSSQHPGRASACEQLAISLWTQYTRTGHNLALEEAIALQREALELRPIGHPDRAKTCINLANSIWTQHERIGDDHLLDEAIVLQREALSFYPEGHPHRALPCGGLALSLVVRFQRTGDVSLLEEAVDLQRNALVLQLKGHPIQVASHVNLANSLFALYKRTGIDDVLMKAIDLQREAINLAPEGHVFRASSYLALSASLRMLYHRVQDQILLDEATELNRHAVALCPTGHRDHMAACVGLADGLQLQFQHSRKESLLSEAISLLQRSSSPSEAQHQIWRCSVLLCSMHLHSDTAFFSVDAAIQFLARTHTSEPDLTYDAVNQTLMCLDMFWNHRLELPHHAALIPTYHHVVTLLPLLINPVLEIRLQLHILRSCHQVGPDAFVNAALAGQWQMGLEAMEMSQGVIWLQRVHLRDPQLADVPRNLRVELEQLMKYIVVNSQVHPEIPMAVPLPHSHDEFHERSSRMYALIRDIRKLPGLERFMQGASYEVLHRASSKHPVVVLIGAHCHFYALIMTSIPSKSSGMIPLELSHQDLVLANVTLRSSRGTPAQHVDGTQRSRVERGARVPKVTSPLDRYLKFIWVKIVKPVVDDLQLKPKKNQERPRLYWCPTGAFTSVPLHAAGIYDGPESQRVSCSDYVVSSYTPTVTTLLRAQHSWKSQVTKDLSIVLMAEKRPKELNLPTIPGVDAELDVVHTTAQSAQIENIHLQSGNTTIANTCEVIKLANIAHIACHGIQDVQEASRSGFCLGDGRLTVSHLANLNIEDGFLTVLSACETAKGSHEQPDQSMHLAAAMLFAGFKSVIATIWSISDADGPKVAKWFYEELFAQEVINADSIPHALDVATSKLRNSGAPSHQWVPFIHMGA